MTAANVNSPGENAYHTHSMRLPIEGLLMDKHPVTTTEYAKYLAESKYEPVDKYNFLKNWGAAGQRTPPADIAKKPVSIHYCCGFQSRNVELTSLVLEFQSHTDQ